MPTYQYSCTECGHFFEQVQSFTEDSLTVCPECQGRLRKVFNAVGVVFKGSGFYRTDSRGASPDAGSGPAKDSSTEKKAADTKPADKPAPSGPAPSSGSSTSSGSSGSSGSSTAGAGVG